MHLSWSGWGQAPQPDFLAVDKLVENSGGIGPL